MAILSNFRNFLMAFLVALLLLSNTSRTIWFERNSNGSDNWLPTWGYLLSSLIPFFFILFNSRQKYKPVTDSIKWNGFLWVSLFYVIIVWVLYIVISETKTYLEGTVGTIILQLSLAYLAHYYMLPDAPDKVSSKDVFISYSHNDKEKAQQLKKDLISKGINVRIDSDQMQPADDILSFIRNSVHESKATILLVSESALLSEWVSMEVVYTFHMEATGQNKRFFACYLDESFQQPGFVDKAEQSIADELSEINRRIANRAAQNLSVAHLVADQQRYLNLKNNIPEVIRRLNASLCLDFRDECYTVSLEKLILAIRSTTSI